MKFSKPILVASLLGLAMKANACPPGSTLQQGVGWQMCVPIPGMSGAAPQPSPSVAPAWATRWGAIAIDMVGGGVGIGAARGMRKERQATNAAIRSCKQKGGTRCTVQITYRDQCAVVISGDKGFVVSNAASVEEATRIGTDRCNTEGNTNCSLYFSDCSFPERVR
ncbi:DUF4189 domain-containing protein [Lysobacter sp. K5869]|nr:DUF4189 domain-containing protein [Lysobacter sp. K5869]